jgi:hypothetical protein
MTRFYKHYTFNLHGEQYKVRTSSLSSYPGGCGHGGRPAAHQLPEQLPRWVWARGQASRAPAP